jgi:hypothetical protein
MTTRQAKQKEIAMDSKKKTRRLFARSEPSPESDTYRQLRHYSRQHTATLWQQSQLGVELSGEEGRLVKAMREHPEYYDLWHNLEQIGDEDVEQDGVNPLMHVMFHAVIENQLAEADPAQVNKTLQALMLRGYTRHEAIHQIASVFIEEFHAVLTEQRPYNEKAYVRKLKKLARG